MSVEDRGYMRPQRDALPTKSKPGPSAFQVVFGLNIAVFLIQHVFGIAWLIDPVTGQRAMPWGGVSLADLARGQFWTLFTHMFVHGSLGHVLMNMILLWFAGRKVQELFGGRHLAQIYVVSGLLGAAVELAVMAYGYGQTSTPMLGASAAVFGVLAALAVALPDDEVTAFLYFVIPVRMRLSTLAWGLVALNLGLGLAGLFWPASPGGAQIAWFAHVGGALGGWYYARALGYDGTPVSQRLQEIRAGRTPARPRETARVRQTPAVIDLEIDLDAAERQNALRTPKYELMEDVDLILDKINDLGFGSLTDEEKRLLDRAGRQIEELDKSC